MFSSSIAPSSRLTTSATRFALILIAITLVGSVLFSASSAHKKHDDGRNRASKPAYGEFLTKGSVQKATFKKTSGMNSPDLFSAFLPQAATPEMIETFAADCVTPKSAFVLGEVVCAKISGGPLFIIPRKFAWVDNENNILQKTDVTTDPQTDLFTLPAVSLTTDYRGVWRVNDISTSRSTVRTSSFFTVADPAEPDADLVVYDNVNTDPANVVAGTNVEFALYVANRGPDVANSVQVTDTVAANATFVNTQQDSGPAFTCNPSAGGVTCTINALQPGEEARIRVIYQSDSGGAAGTVISNTAGISSSTAEANTNNNSATAEIKITANNGGVFCSLVCPDNITVNANTSEGGVRGAHVTYSDPSGNTECGSITSTPASGSFFPVGTTTVSATSETGGGSCTFLITVEDVNENVSISCPPNQELTANNNCEAPVNLGNPTFTGDNVTISVIRSDGKPMYDCDVNGQNCTRKTTDLPFPAGVTTVTWTATSHDTPGPYADPDDEEAHRTGNASCTQVITVDDTVPPVITAPPGQQGSADGTCQAAVPDFTQTATVSDNCACASSDQAQSCVDRERIVVTQSPAAGTLVGLGSHTITLTANDGSSNNGGAGNTATATTTFTVNDTTAPTITSCPASVTTTNDANLCSAVVSVGAATATDNCDSNPSVVGNRSDNQPLNAPYPVGTTTITWTATDASNNSSTCIQTVTVNDIQPPTISCPVDMIVDFDAGVGGAVVTYSPPVGSDNCPGATTVQTAGLASGATFPLGTTTNTFRVTDGAGLTAECSFKVTVALTSIVGVDSATINGSGLVDSYDSTGGYPATKGSLANILTNGTLTVGGSAKVFGNVRSTRVGVSLTGTSQVTGNATAGTTVSKGASAIVGGTITNNALAPLMALPAVPACGPPYSPNSGISGTYSYNPSTGDLTLSGINSATLANGNYCFHNVTMTNSGQLKVNGLVVIKLTGTFSASGATSITNTTAIPANFRILSSYSGSNGVTISNGTSVHLVVYAPNTGVTITGAAPLFGTVAGKTVTVSNSGMIHYDTRLKTVWPDIWTLIFGP